MKKRLSILLELILLSIPKIIIDYALISMWVFSRFHWSCILFIFAAMEVEAFYWEKARTLTGSKAIAIVLNVLCLAAVFAVLYATGYIDGTLVPW